MLDNPSFLARYGSRLLDQGYAIVPIMAGTKYPKNLKDWNSIKASPLQLEAWLNNDFSDGGVGILTENTPSIDIDVYDAAVVNKLVQWCERHIGPTPQRVGQAPKLVLPYRSQDPFTKMASRIYRDRSGARNQIEILGVGQQFVAYANHPKTKRPYMWSGKSLAEVAHDQLPILTKEKAQELIDYFETIIPDDWHAVDLAHSSKRFEATSLDRGERMLSNVAPKLELSTQQIQQCLELLIEHADDYHHWIKIGMALYHQFDGDTAGLRLWDNWSQSSTKYTAREIPYKWHGFKANLQSVRPVTFASVVQLAKEQHNLKSQKQERQAGFRLIPASELMSRSDVIHWQVKNYIEANTVGLLFGDPGSYKSFLAIDLALHIAAGKNWHDNQVKQGSVVYVAGEGHNGLKRRFSAWEKHNNISVSELPIYISQRAALFYDEASTQDVAEAIGAVAAQTGSLSLIVIDTLARNFGPGDENSTADMTIFLDHVDRLIRARFKSTVLLVHHTGHSNKNRARGSMVLKGGVDFEYRVERTEHSSKVCLTCTKVKDAAEPDPTWFEAQEIVVGQFEEEDLTSLAFTKSEAPIIVEEEAPLKGKQADLYQLIKQEGPVERETLRQIALREGYFSNANQFRCCLRELVSKDKALENDGRVSVIDEAW